jgi:hypothetical protein
MKKGKVALPATARNELQRITEQLRGGSVNGTAAAASVKRKTKSSITSSPSSIQSEAEAEVVTTELITDHNETKTSQSPPSRNGVASSSSSMSVSVSSLRGMEWWRALGSPGWIMSPMVGQSELAFRMLARRHGCQLCYTPMIIAKQVWPVVSHRYIQMSRVGVTECNDQMDECGIVCSIRRVSQYRMANMSNRSTINCTI